MVSGAGHLLRKSHDQIRSEFLASSLRRAERWSVEALKDARRLLAHHFLTQNTGMNSVFT
jgi:hypothetical protein